MFDALWRQAVYVSITSLCFTFFAVPPGGSACSRHVCEPRIPSIKERGLPASDPTSAGSTRAFNSATWATVQIDMPACARRYLQALATLSRVELAACCEDSVLMKRGARALNLLWVLVIALVMVR